MTREEAIKELEEMQEYYCFNESEIDALYMAIEALEQEPVLDKIRNEMEDILIINQDEERIYQQIKAIIDKYRSESEG